VLRALIEGAVGDDHLGHARGHRQRRLLHRRSSSTAAVADLAEEFQVPDPGGPRDRGLQVRVHRERHQTVDVGRRQPGVGQGVEHGLGCQPQLASAGVLREVGGADARDRGLAGETVGHAAPPKTKVALAIT
jgi:hypothetical protein